MKLITKNYLHFMEPGLFYIERLRYLNEYLKSLLKKESRIGMLRLTATVILLAGIYLLWGRSLFTIISAALVFSILFSQILLADSKNKSVILHTRKLIAINEDEVKALEHDFMHFPDGHQFLPDEHFYANDLDIFGKSSIYQYINRTTSEIGNRLLASWLLTPPEPGELPGRQAAIKELRNMTDWRQEFQSTGTDTRIQYATGRKLHSWINTPDIFLLNKTVHVLIYLVPIIMFIITGAYISDLITWKLFTLALAAGWLFSDYNSKKIKPIHQQLSQMVEEMEVLSASLEWIETASFISPLLVSIQHTCRSSGNSGSKEIKKLKKIMEKLDLRLNRLLGMPLEIYLCWGVHQVIRLEKWKKVNKENIESWFSTIAQFEALNSLANLSFNNPDWVFPIFDKEHFFLEGMSIGHPLIAGNKRVSNDISIDHTSDLMVVTGSNMAGKSTYLRSIGVNVVLAMTGSPVCGSYFRLSPVQILSSMRIEDNLAESTSTFYAELKKLKTIIDKVNNGDKVFILLDEILRGTNSLDRNTGSIALLKQLLRKQAVGIIATHDVELAELKKEYPDNIMNFHFDVQVNNEELFFDYKLKEGVCTSMNASILMKKIGIEV